MIRQGLADYIRDTTPMLQEFERAEILLTYEIHRGVKDYPEMRKEVERRLAAIK